LRAAASLPPLAPPMAPPSLERIETAGGLLNMRTAVLQPPLKALPPLPLERIKTAGPDGAVHSELAAAAECAAVAAARAYRDGAWLADSARGALAAAAEHTAAC
jgi:hypothetical protein